MTQIQKSPRNSAIELLRILAMGMIVLSHICVHSGFDRTYSPVSVNRLFLQFSVLGNLGVVLFMLISGYFQCESTLKTRSLSRLLGQVWFYSIGLFLICRFGFGVEYSGDALWAVFLPTVYNEYWFFTAYFVLFLLSPFVNRLLQVLSRRQLETLLAVMLLCWVLVPTLTKQQMYGAELPQFLLFYLLGAYFRLYPDNWLKKRRVHISLALISMLLLYGLTVVYAYWERYSPEAFGASDRLYNRNSALIVLWAVGMFALAIYSKPFTSRFINALGSCTFGVYLIHDNPAVRNLLWKDWLHWGHYFTSGSFIPRLMFSVVMVYAVCTAIEWLRQKTLAKPMETAIDRILSRLLKKASFV